MLPVTGRYFDQTDSFCFDLKRLNFHFAFLSLFGHFLHPFLGSKGEIGTVPVPWYVPIE